MSDYQQKRIEAAYDNLRGLNPCSCPECDTNFRSAIDEALKAADAVPAPSNEQDAYG